MKAPRCEGCAKRRDDGWCKRHKIAATKPCAFFKPTKPKPPVNVTKPLF